MATSNGPAVCKDCRAAATEAGRADLFREMPKRPAPHPGPRCATHHRAMEKRRNAQKHASAVKIKFGAEGDWYERMYAYQHGRCYICWRATGATRRLAVDHDHKLEGTGKDTKRGLLCKPCNSMLAHARDDAEVFKRATDYLIWPPARQMAKES